MNSYLVRAMAVAMTLNKICKTVDNIAYFLEEMAATRLAYAMTAFPHDHGLQTQMYISLGVPCARGVDITNVFPPDLAKHITRTMSANKQDRDLQEAVVFFLESICSHEQQARGLPAFLKAGVLQAIDDRRLILRTRACSRLGAKRLILLPSLHFLARGGGKR